MSLNTEELADGGTLPAELSNLLAAYRTALPGPEAGAEFMPGLWARIDERRRENYSFARLARGFVTAAGAICLMFSAALWIPHATIDSHTVTYVDVLANDSSGDDAVETQPVTSESL